jgi:uncharacterized protein
MSILNIFKKLSIIGLITVLSTMPLYADDAIKQSTITINGSHSVLVSHDSAIIRGSVVTENIKADQAVQENAKIIEQVKNNLKQNKINPKDLVSNQYNLVINHDYPDGKQVFKNYQVTHDISIETKDINQIGVLADLLTEAGVNHISQVEFISSKAKEAYDSALKNAVLDAKNKAGLAISGLSGVSIGEALSVQVNSQNHAVQPVMYAKLERAMVASSDVPTQFQTKGQTINVDVHTIWEIINP